MARELRKQLRDAKPLIMDADLLLFRGKGYISRLIRSYGRGRYSHAAKASWLKGELFCLEVRELKGGRAVTLESQVRKFPGMIDVYRANAIGTQLYDRIAADKLMLLFAGVEYGYWDILQTWLLHLPVLRLLAKANVDDDFVSKRPPYCSAAVAISDRVGGGVDPVPSLADNETEPNDLARSPFYQGFRNEGYLFTLMPDEPPPMETAPVPETNEAAKAMAVQSEVVEPVSVNDIVEANGTKKCEAD